MQLDCVVISSVPTATRPAVAIVDSTLSFPL